MYNLWTDKESCFNLCLRTTIRNGAQFDCRSFEHWHRDCPESITTASSTTTSTSASSSGITTMSNIWSSSTRLGLDGALNSSADGLVGAMPPMFGSTTISPPSKTCASFSLNDNVQDEDEAVSSGSRDESASREDKLRGQHEKMSRKRGYCVLSNQTMKSAGRLFAPNNKVTYYEILCKSMSRKVYNLD